jgi:hypothetical protein
MATKTKQISVSDKLDEIQNMIEDLASDIYDGDITQNQIGVVMDRVITKIENLKDFL